MIAQVKRVVRSGSLKPQQVHVPGVLVDHVVVDPDQQQTTQTRYDPAISGEIMRPKRGDTAYFTEPRAEREPRHYS